MPFSVQSNHPARRKPAIIVLEDGRCFEGLAAGAPGQALGELVFNTSMSGYQEVLTDPSYAGQLVTFTAPHIGNYGVNPADMESSKIQAAGLIARDISSVTSNYRAEAHFEQWLMEHSIVAISDVDTRALTRHIRDKGVMKAMIVHDARRENAEKFLTDIHEQPDYGLQDFVAKVACTQPMSVRIEPVQNDRASLLASRVQLTSLSGQAPSVNDLRPHVVVVDFGVKFSILRHLDRVGCRVTLVPKDYSAEQIRRLSPHGVLLSNGPGDPALLDAYAPTIRELADRHVVMGICLGHQMIGRAFGAKTYKLAFGHRGPNQPVMDLCSKQVAMTSQNHGYAVDADSLGDDLEITHMNINDHTVAGFRHREKAIFGVQYHPEAGPGPHDAQNCFDQFVDMIASHRVS